MIRSSNSNLTLHTQRSYQHIPISTLSVHHVLTIDQPRPHVSTTYLEWKSGESADEIVFIALLN